jgi:signal transduction histidine kinase/CheY-like chemotaxis protein/HPt (histidine-containing phosphotransfer) domain-containing protein
VILLGVLGLLIAALFVLATLQVRGARQQTRAENQRTASFLLADSMRQSSNDLTNMVRLYVATGRPEYRRYYNQILAIRAGTAPRPVGYDSSLWDRVLSQGEGFVRYGPAESLTAEMRAARFRLDEFRALKAALDASSGLAGLERTVMAQAAARIHRGVDARYPADVAPLYRRLVDHAYLAQKGRIMGAIRRFIALVDGQTLRSVQNAQSHNSDLARIEIAILVAIVLVGLAAIAVLSRMALRPLATLIAATRRIADGDYGRRVEVRGVAELEDVAQAFNEMAGAVEADVAARKHAEDEAIAALQVAEHASRAKTTFLAAMSHEIRTPMIGVTGMLEVLARTELTPQQRQMVATAEGSAASLLQIIGDILDFSKIEADKLELSPTTFSVTAVVRTAVETFVHTASAKGLLLNWSVDEAVSPAHVGDPLRIRQIVSNLVSNAVKFTEVGGIEVTVRVLEASAEAQTVEIAVIDTGIGIEPGQQQRLFAEFTQATASTSRQYGGTGLGLVICKRLAVLMGGDITLESTPGRGTTMRLVAPMPTGDPEALADDLDGTLAAPPTSRPMPTRQQAEREGSLLLLAEDHPVNRTVLRHQLALIGFQVDCAPDGQVAFEQWMSGRYALVLTDLNMPRLDGYELARQIRAHEREIGSARIPIIALSANVMQGEPDKCRAAGMDDFAAKPTTIPVLAGRLRRWLPHLEWPSRAEPATPASTTAPSTNGAMLLDAAILTELTGGDADLEAEIVADFVATTHADLAALRLALDGRDVDETRRQAHRIKGAARIVGAHEIARPAERIEALSRDGVAAAEIDWPALEALVERLSAGLDRAVGAPSATSSRGPGP